MNFPKISVRTQKLAQAQFKTFKANKSPPQLLETHLEAPLQFTFITTDDGSPSVRLGQGEGSSEAMHNLRGAFTETLYIYGHAIDLALASNFEPRVLSLGLGLGYVETLSAGLALKFAKSLQSSDSNIQQQTEISSTPHSSSASASASRPSSNSNLTRKASKENQEIELSHQQPQSPADFLARVGGESFELFPDLREWFSNWALGEGRVPADFILTYDSILKFVSGEVGVAAFEIHHFLGELIQSGRWLIRPALESSTEFSRNKFGVICFDAFCSKTSPQLWDEEFLRDFVFKTAAPRAVFSTYACTSALNRRLVNCGFQLNKRAGFAGKRASTFAIRDPLHTHIYHV